MASRKTSFLTALFLLGAQQPAQAGAVLGLEWTVSSEKPALQSDLEVGEFDGLLRGPLQPYFGWKHERHQVLGSFAIALFASSIDERKTQLGNLRLSTDYRFSFVGPEKPYSAWLGIGAYQLIPLLKDVNPDYSDTESDISEIQLSERRAELAGTGCRVGTGIDFPLSSSFSLGVHHHIGLHLNFRSIENSTLLTSFTTGETGFKAHVEF